MPPDSETPNSGPIRNSLYRNLFLSMADGILIGTIVHDAAGQPADIRILDANPAYLQQYRREYQDTRGRLLSEVTAYQGSETLWAARGDKVLDTGVPQYYEGVGGRPDQWVLVILSKVSEKHLAIVIKDMTKRKKAEDAVRQSEQQHRQLADQLQEADRSKDVFIATLGHELRNTLTPLVNSVEILNHTVPHSAQTGRALTTIERQIEQVNYLIHDLLDINRIKQNQLQLERERQDLRQLVQNAVQGLRPSFYKKALKVKTNLPKQPVWADVDPARMGQVIGNLLQNAHKFTPTGGTVTITLADDKAKGVARLIVRDTGIGIPDSLKDAIFQPFIQIPGQQKERPAGLGLGLALARDLVCQHSGKIWAENPKNAKGAKFIIELPLVNSQTTDSKECPDSPSSKHRRYHVLIIDDNRELALSFSELLGLLQFEARVAYSGGDGLQALLESKPDVILCDLTLPDMSGCHFAQKMREYPEHKDIPLIAITGYSLTAQIEEVYEAGFDRLLIKPINIHHLQSAILDVISERYPHD